MIEYRQKMKGDHGSKIWKVTWGALDHASQSYCAWMLAFIVNNWSLTKANHIVHYTVCFWHSYYCYVAKHEKCIHEYYWQLHIARLVIVITMVILLIITIILWNKLSCCCSILLIHRNKLLHIQHVTVDNLLCHSDKV